MLLCVLGKGFCDEEPEGSGLDADDEFVARCRKLRVLNHLRSEQAAAWWCRSGASASVVSLWSSTVVGVFLMCEGGERWVCR